MVSTGARRATRRVAPNDHLDREEQVRPELAARVRDRTCIRLEHRTDLRADDVVMTCIAGAPLVQRAVLAYVAPARRRARSGDTSWPHRFTACSIATADRRVRSLAAHSPSCL